MNFPKLLSSLVFILLFFNFCAAPKKTQVPKPPTVEEINQELEPIEISPEVTHSSISADTIPVYRPSQTRLIDILHTKLDLSFDWAKQHVIGKATIKLRPYNNPLDSFYLDGRNFIIHDIKELPSQKQCLYRYDGNKIAIQTNKTLSKNDSLTIVISYTARPAERENKKGSQAITSDQGLYFINHDQSHPTKPMQIWTQGETESNSNWFPTFDKPNERCTGEIVLTVPDTMQTLANGTLLSSVKNANNTRTDHYSITKPHAPYLFMLAVGKFAVVKDTWRDIPLLYMVEPEYGPYAKNIFPHTPEMLEFFSTKLNYKYPWSKYGQVVVRDYVSGAMENTTAVIFGEFVQRHPKEIADNKMNELIVAHEMFHHWFGDLVTCESWSNLTLNEGFANYSEYLWLEHKYGKDEAEAHRYDEKMGYMQSSAFQGVHPLIWYSYDDKEQMFDAHSYNKGGLVLHMLRNYLGDNTFFEGLNHYLRENEYTAVEVHDLRKSFEYVSGQDLNWFFNQWFLASGHPHLIVSNQYNAAKKTVKVNVEQIQDFAAGVPIFQFPTTVDIHTADGKVLTKNIYVSKRTESFEFEVSDKPLLVNFDTSKSLLCELENKRDRDANILLFKKAKNLATKIEAMLALNEETGPEITQLWVSALNDPSWRVRQFALKQLDGNSTGEITSAIAKLTNDPNSNVQILAMKKLKEANATNLAHLIDNAITGNSPYSVAAEGIRSLKELEPTLAFAQADRILKTEDYNSELLNTIGDLYATAKDTTRFGFFQKNWSSVKDNNILSFGNHWTSSLGSISNDTKMNVANFLTGESLNSKNGTNKRLASTKIIKNILDEFILSKAKNPKSSADKDIYIPILNQKLKDIKAFEKDKKLSEIYKEF